MKTWGQRPGLLVAWWAWTPAVYGLGWCLRLVTPGHRFVQSADQWFYANYLSFGGWFWMWFTVGFAGTAVIVARVTANHASDVRTPGRVRTPRRTKSAPVPRPASRPVSGPVRAIAIAVPAALAIAAFTQTWRVVWDNDKDFARYYNESTVFYAPSLTASGAPPSLYRLLSGARPASGGRCDLIGSTDVPGCIKQGTLATTGWDARLSSANGAAFALSRSSGDMQNVSLNTSTVTYLNAWHGHPARWSGVMDGKGISQGMGGVAEWNGSKVTTCDFSGRYDIGRSFGGSNMADMSDLLAQEYPSLRWTITDVWGYCDGSEPVVVIPVTRMIRFMNRTVNTAAGIILVRGDYGKTRLVYQPAVRGGELPGPVYPKSLVDTQLTEASWAAGRGSMNNGGFGYEPATSAAQAGNVSDYLLRDTATGRLEWVTPLTLRNSSSELFVAYAISAADTVTNGSLNQLSIYVLAPGDPRQINVDNMEAEARNWLAQEQPGFISSGGRLLEFTPVDGDMWRAYGELNGRVVYLLDIDATGKVAPTLTSVSSLGGPADGPVGSAPVTAVCGRPLSTLTTSQLAFCLREFADQLSQREGQPSS
jgi:hypothetical protein